MNWLSFCIGAFIGAVIGAVATKIVDVIWNKGEIIITKTPPECPRFLIEG